jgi:ectoine hydroxylase-related dioxygenase (phytanoyl-CoA dioxygenase family)
MQETLSDSGFEIVPSVLSRAEVDELRAALSALDIAPGHRQLMQRVPEVRALALSEKIATLLEGRLAARAVPVRSIFFDKTPEANWLVPWHQDLTIAVQERREVPGYGPWSVKGGVPHVQPPAPFLESMLTIRLHLDDCDVANGALRVIPGSHRRGRLSAAEIAEARAQQSEVLCSMHAGDVLLHASSEARDGTRRRVVHLEYATALLPDGLAWAES